MEDAILMDKILKLLIEDDSVKTSGQISKQLNISHERTGVLLEEMQNQKHITVEQDANQLSVIISVTSLGKHFYNNSAYVNQNEQTNEIKGITAQDSLIENQDVGVDDSINPKQWYEKPLFIYFIWPLLVLITGIAIGFLINGFISG